MVKINDIFNGINLMLISYSSFSNYTVYIQRCTKDFDRPSFLIEYIKTSKRDVNRNTVEKTSYFTITGFEKTDKYYRSDQNELINIQENVLELFSSGYVLVGDRSIKVKSSTGGLDLDRAYIDLQFEFFDNRTDAEDTTPLITSVTTNLQEG